jgi:hypothetical protein
VDVASSRAVGFAIPLHRVFGFAAGGHADGSGLDRVQLCGSSSSIRDPVSGSGES